MLLLRSLLLAAAASMDLFARATDPNPTLNSYTASVQLSATLHAAIPIRRRFSGTVSYVRPNRTIAFTGVSGQLRRFADLAAATPAYEQAMQQYAITPATDDQRISSYTLVPREAGSGVKAIVVTIEDKTALVHGAKWRYANGGILSLTQTYARDGRFRLPAKAQISARFPGYSADGTMTFRNYRSPSP